LIPLNETETLEQAIENLKGIDYSNWSLDEMEEQIFIKARSRELLRRKTKLDSVSVKNKLIDLEHKSYVTLGEFIYNKAYQKWYDCDFHVKHDGVNYSLIYDKTDGYCFVRLDLIHVSLDEVLN